MTLSDKLPKEDLIADVVPTDVNTEAVSEVEPVDEPVVEPTAVIAEIEPVPKMDSVPEPIKAVQPKPRIFQIGPTRIVENPQMLGKSNEDVRGILMSMYPEIKDATLTKQVQGDTTVVLFKPKVGRKG